MMVIDITSLHVILQSLVKPFVLRHCMEIIWVRSVLYEYVLCMYVKAKG